MTDPRNPSSIIEGRLSRKVNNALTMTFQDGPGEPFGQAVQAGAGGLGAKVGVLFGFKNGGTGVHVYTPVLGSALRVESRDKAPTLLTREDGSAVATIERGAACTATAASGAAVLRWTDRATDAKTPEAFHLDVSRPDGTVVAHQHLIRTLAGWSLGRELVGDYLWYGHAGQPLKLPFLGVSIEVLAPLGDGEREVLIASCIDMAIGLRPYGTAMA